MRRPAARWSRKRRPRCLRMRARTARFGCPARYCWRRRGGRRAKSGGRAAAQFYRQLKRSNPESQGAAVWRVMPGMANPAGAGVLFNNNASAKKDCLHVPDVRPALPASSRRRRGRRRSWWRAHPGARRCQGPDQPYCYAPYYNPYYCQYYSYNYDYTPYDSYAWGYEPYAYDYGYYGYPYGVGLGL